MLWSIDTGSRPTINSLKWLPQNLSIATLLQSRVNISNCFGASVRPTYLIIEGIISFRNHSFVIVQTPNCIWNLNKWDLLLTKRNSNHQYWFLMKLHCRYTYVYCITLQPIVYRVCGDLPTELWWQCVACHLQWRRISQVEINEMSLVG